MGPTTIAKIYLNAVKGKSPAEAHAKSRVFNMIPAQILPEYLYNHHEANVEIVSSGTITQMNSMKKPSVPGIIL
jgi:hypothetical protein